MQTKGKTLVRYAAIALAGAVIATYFLPKQQEVPTPQPRDYAEIAAEGTLRAITEYNSISYHVNQDSLSGFHYELVEAFARDHGLQVEVTPEMSFHKRLKALETGQQDLIANGIPATSEWKDSLLLTVPILLNKQVLVQRKASSDADTTFIKSLVELAGKTLHTVKDSPTILRIRNLEEEIGDTIYIKEVEKYGMEQLISMVAHGDIDYAVCEETIASAAADSLPQIDISTAISFTQFYAWGVSKQSPVLLDSLNQWLDKYTKTKEYRSLYKKYYR